MSRAYVDISSHNGTPNLKAYRDAGHTDLMLKATEGTGYYWPLMQQMAREWHSFGPQFRVGYYDWLYGTLSGAAQFAWFWRQVGPVFRRNRELDEYGQERGDWLMVDFEDVDPSRWVSDAQHLTVLRVFAVLASACGQLHFYAPDWYLSNLPQCRAWLPGRPVVASDYSHNPPRNHYGLTFVAHQYTDRATVPGFAAPVDYNRWLTEPNTTTGDALSGPTTQQLADLINADAADVKRDIHGTEVRVAEMDPVIMGLDAFLLQCVLALSGQADTIPGLPAGQKITNLTTLAQRTDAGFAALSKQLAAALATVNARLDAIGAPSADTVRAAIDAGITEALDGLSATLTFGGKPA